MKVLLVDDDAELLASLGFCLSRAGIDVVTARGLPEAVEQLESARPHVAVLDVELGSCSGLDILEAFRSRSRIPVIMLTGANRDDIRLRCFDLGASRFHLKPISASELARTLREVVSEPAQTIHDHVQGAASGNCARPV